MADVVFPAVVTTMTARSQVTGAAGRRGWGGGRAPLLLFPYKPTAHKVAPHLSTLTVDLFPSLNSNNRLVKNVTRVLNKDTRVSPP